MSEFAPEYLTAADVWMGIAAEYMAEIQRLRAALAPFAAFSARYPTAPGTTLVLVLQDSYAPVTMGDMHRARLLTTPATETANV